jgi:hypothetical protein
MILDGDINFMNHVIDLKDTWHNLPCSPKEPYPFTFSLEEMQEILADFEAWRKAFQTMDRVKDAVGPLFPNEGAIKHELYDEAIRALTQVRDAVIEEYATNEIEKEIWIRQWPFGTR